MTWSTLAADGTDEAFAVRILPGRPWRTHNFFDVHVLDSTSEELTVDRVAMNTSTVGVTDFNKLPNAAKAYIKKIQSLLGVDIQLISTGQKRDEMHPDQKPRLMNKRKNLRITKRLEARFIASGASFVGITSNLSETGLFIRTKRGFAPDSILDLELIMPDGNVSRLKGIVKSTVKVPL